MPHLSYSCAGENEREPRGKKSQHGCVRWALHEKLSSSCCDFACGRLWDHHQNIEHVILSSKKIIGEEQTKPTGAPPKDIGGEDHSQKVN